MITSLESNIGCCQALPQSSGDSERLPFCFFVFFFFFCCFVFIRLSLGTRSLCTREQFASWTYLACPFLYKCFYMCVLGPATIQGKVAVAS